MSESRLNARIVRLDFHTGRTGLLYATSPDLKGLVLGRASLDELQLAIPQAIADMYAACGEAVLVTKLSPDDNIGDAWVAMPAEAARAALASQSSSQT